MASSSTPPPTDSSVPPPTPPTRLPDGLVHHHAATLSHASALELYKRDQLLLLKLDAHLGGAHDQAAPTEFGWGVLREIYAKHPAVFSSCWCVENAAHMANGKDDLTPAKLLGVAATTPPPTGPFYVSTILQEDPEALKSFFKTLPFEQPPLLADKRHDDSCWLFLGVNPKRDGEGGRRPCKRRRTEVATAAGDKGAEDKEPGTGNGENVGEVKGYKESRGDNGGGEEKEEEEEEEERSHPIMGRGEHTDDVHPYDGTWHCQIRGTKTWYVRPLDHHPVWQGRPPKLAGKPGAFGGASESTGCVPDVEFGEGEEGGQGEEEGSDDGLDVARLRIKVEQGDVLVINTKAWYHQTHIEVQPGEDGLSCSFARDWYI